MKPMNKLFAFLFFTLFALEISSHDAKAIMTVFEYAWEYVCEMKKWKDT